MNGHLTIYSKMSVALYIYVSRRCLALYIYKARQNIYNIYLYITNNNLKKSVCVFVCVFVCGKFPSAYIKRTVRVTGLVFSV